MAGLFASLAVVLVQQKKKSAATIFNYRET